MNKRELTNQLAKQSHTSKAKAADDVDSLVYGLLKEMKDTLAKPDGEKPAGPMLTLVKPSNASGAPKPPSSPTGAKGKR